MDTPEAVRQQLRDYFFNAARFGDNEVLDEFIRRLRPEQRRRQGLYRPDPGGLQRPWRDRGAPARRRGRCLRRGQARQYRPARGHLQGELGIAKRLLATECDPNQRNNAGQTPAMYAALFQREALLELRERGADLNAADPLGNSVESLARGEIRTR